MVHPITTVATAVTIPLSVVVELRLAAPVEWAQLDHQEHPVLTETPAKMEHPAWMEHLETMQLQTQYPLQLTSALTVLQHLLALLDGLGLPDLPEIQEHQVKTEALPYRDLLGHQGRWDHQEQMANPEHLDSPVHLGKSPKFLASLGPQDHPDQ